MTRYIIILLFLLIGACQPSKNNAPIVDEVNGTRPVDLVYPLLDAAHSRWFFFNAATRPFGMVNLSPDTQVKGAWGSGYRYDTDTIKGFSHVHAWQIAGPSVMPLTLEDENYDALFENYFSPFDHQKEVVEVGYHAVELERFHIKAELSSTTRVGFHRYTYPDGQTKGLLFNLGGHMGPTELVNSVLNQAQKNVLTGYVDNAPTKRRPKSFRVFFYILLNEPIKEIKKGVDGKYLAIFQKSIARELKMKVGISYTSVENAKLNLQSELGHWSFAQVVDESKAEWNDLLSRITIEGGTEKEQRRFYTDLWHALQGRRIISDVNGAYPDNTSDNFRIGQLPFDQAGKPLFNHYNSDSFWGAQWTLNTLWGLVYPEIYEQFVNSLLIYYADGGMIPRGPSGGNYTYVMTGASTTPFIVSAYQKGIKGFDIDQAYEGLRKNHFPGGIMARAGYEHDSENGGGLEDFIEKGYVPYPNPDGNFGFHQDGASLTLEYAYQDWTLAQLAKALGKENDYDYFLKRSQNYKNQFDPESGWMRPKDVAGQWKTPFNPYLYEHGFNESNGAQSTWFVPHDIPGLATLMGGKTKAAEKLNQQFKTAQGSNFVSGTAHDRERDPELSKIPINFGNQPSIQTAFIFNHLDRPDLTQYWSRAVAKQAFGGLSPYSGYNGDEDQGLMGALSVLLKIGLFQLTGGTEENPVYELGSPQFDKIAIALNKTYYPGEQFVIEVLNNAEKNCYIKSVKWKGEERAGFSIPHHEIIQGGVLQLEMSKKSKHESK